MRNLHVDKRVEGVMVPMGGAVRTGGGMFPPGVADGSACFAFVSISEILAWCRRCCSRNRT
jgi:hypothetical protein